MKKLLVLTLLALSVPFLASAATYSYVNTSGVLKSVEASSDIEANALAVDKSINSGFMVSNTVVATTTTNTAPSTDLSAMTLDELRSLKADIEAEISSRTIVSTTDTTPSTPSNPTPSTNTSDFSVRVLRYEGEVADDFIYEGNKRLDVPAVEAYLCYRTDCTVNANTNNQIFGVPLSESYSNGVYTQHFRLSILGSSGSSDGQVPARPATFRIAVRTDDGDLQYWHVTLTAINTTQEAVNAVKE